MTEEAYCMGIWLASILAGVACGYMLGIGMMTERPVSCKRLPDIDLGRYADEADEQAACAFQKTASPIWLHASMQVYGGLSAVFHKPASGSRKCEQ